MPHWLRDKWCEREEFAWVVESAWQAGLAKKVDATDLKWPFGLSVETWWVCYQLAVFAPLGQIQQVCYQP